MAYNERFSPGSQTVTLDRNFIFRMIGGETAGGTTPPLGCPQAEGFAGGSGWRRRPYPPSSDVALNFSSLAVSSSFYCMFVFLCLYIYVCMPLVCLPFLSLSYVPPSPLPLYLSPLSLPPSPPLSRYLVNISVISSLVCLHFLQLSACDWLTS